MGALPLREKRGTLGWQAECCFHKLREKKGDQSGSMCRKLMNYSAADADSLQEAERRCIVRLRYWCVSHVHYNRQRRHLSFHPLYEECPDMEVLELQKGSDDDRPVLVLSDAELDAMEAEAAAPARRRRRAA